MRILVVSNLYPPHYIGGYELGCQQVVEALKQQGHQVKVLTSSYGVEKPASDGETYRWLEIETPWLGQKPKNTHLAVIQKERVNQAAFNRLCRDFKPDIIYIWNAAYISLSVAFLARQMNIPVFYYISDMWLAHWENDTWFGWCAKKSPRAAKRAFAAVLKLALNATGIKTVQGSLNLNHVQFTSLFIKEKTAEAGKSVADSQVVHWGVDVNRYSSGKESHPPRRLLYVGQTREHKGIYTAVEAFKTLKERNENLRLTLTVAGGSAVREEDAALQRHVASLDLENDIVFTGLIPRAEIIPLYQTHDILIFPSMFEEPFSITLLEGLSSGLAVVGTTTGGSREILQNGVNSLTFPAGNVCACADQLQRLLDDQELYEKVRRNGRQTVVDQFQFNTMMSKISDALEAA